MVNCCRKVLFCDTESVWRTVPERYCFVMQSHCGELSRKVLFCDDETVGRSVAGRYCFVIWSKCGELL